MQDTWSTSFSWECNNAVDNVVEGYFCEGDCGGNGDEIERADINADGRAWCEDPPEILVSRLAPRVQEGGGNIKHFRGDLQHSIPAWATYNHTKWIGQDGWKILDKLVVHGTDHDVGAGHDHRPVGKLRDEKY